MPEESSQAAVGASLNKDKKTRGATLPAMSRLPVCGSGMVRNVRRRGVMYAIIARRIRRAIWGCGLQAVLAALVRILARAFG